MTDGWQPTHTVAPGGLPGWQEPSAADPPTGQLDPGLAVAVVERQGDWARIVASNGWAAWVASAGLIPVASGPRRRAWLVPVVVGLVAVALVGGVLALAGGGDGDGGAGAATAVSTDASRAAVALVVPPGWAVSEDGLVTAQDAADLASGTPAGPRLEASVDADQSPSLDLLTSSIDDGAAATATVLEQPADVTVSGAPGVALTVQRGTRVQRTVVVHRGAVVVTFTADVPADQWDVLGPVVVGIPGLD